MRWGLLAAAVLLLEAACRSGAVPRAMLVPPSAMAAGLLPVLADRQLDRDILLSLAEVAATSLLATGAGFGLGAALRASPPLRRAAEPLLASYYAVPTFMLYPVFIILFGVGPVAIVAISSLLAVVAMMSATMLALDRVPPVLRRTAATMRLPPIAAAWRIVVPAALPHLFTGVKLTVSYAFIGVIASEFILSGGGIGYAIADAYNDFQTGRMYSLMLLVLLLVAAVNAGFAVLDRRLQARRAAT